MPDLPLNDSYYATGDFDGSFRSGEAFHIVRNRFGGSVATPIARFYITRPAIGPEGFHPHSHLDCFVRRHKLSPSPEWLGRTLAEALIAYGDLAEPIWIGWHTSEAVGGEDRGEVFDPD